MHLYQMRSLGGLLKYLDNVRVGIQLEEAHTTVPVMAINTFSLLVHWGLYVLSTQCWLVVRDVHIYRGGS